MPFLLMTFGAPRQKIWNIDAPDAVLREPQEKIGRRGAVDLPETNKE